jgi:hypothetical protein
LFSFASVQWCSMQHMTLISRVQEAMRMSYSRF